MILVEDALGSDPTAQSSLKGCEGLLSVAPVPWTDDEVDASG